MVKDLLKAKFKVIFRVFKKLECVINYVHNVDRNFVTTFSPCYEY